MYNAYASTDFVTSSTLTINNSLHEADRHVFLQILLFAQKRASDKPHFIKIRGEAVILNNCRMEEEVVKWLEKEDLMDLMKIFESKYLKEIYS